MRKYLLGHIPQKMALESAPLTRMVTFFSTDGIYPTAFGQAVIANESIKVINAKFGTEIPLIATREYLEEK